MPPMADQTVSPPLPAAPGTSSDHCKRSTLGTFADCPHCGGDLYPEHAHFRCGTCGWRDSCCD